MACYKKIFIILFILLCFFIINNNIVYADALIEKCTDSDIINAVPEVIKNSDTFHYLLRYYIDNNGLYYYSFSIFTNDSLWCYDYSTGSMYPRNTSYVNVRGSYFLDTGISKQSFLTNLSNARATTNQNKNYIDTIATNNYTAYYLSDIDIYDQNNSLFLSNTNIVPPNISTPLEDLEDLNFTALGINAWSYSTNQDLELLVYDRNFDENDVRNLYPINTIKLNWNSPYYADEITSNPTTNSLYLIPIEDLGLKFQLNGSYSFRFGIKQGTSYSYVGDITNFTLSSNVTSEIINNINNKVQNTIEQNRHNETINELNNIQRQNQQFQNSILDTSISNDTDNAINNSLTVNNDNEFLQNLNNGFFSRLTSLVSNLFIYDIQEVETVTFQIPYTNQSYSISSDCISRYIPQELKVIIVGTWTFTFTLYFFKFFNNLLIAIKSGKILEGYKNNDEVITNIML